MQEFNFSVDVKVATWERTRLTIDAENLEEARKKLLDINPDVFAGSADDLPNDVKRKSRTIFMCKLDYYPNGGQLNYEMFDETINETIFAKP